MRRNGCKKYLPAIFLRQYFHVCIIAFSRNERTHPNFVSQAQEIEIFCEDCQLAAPVSFFRGFEPRFSVHLLRHACSPLWFLFQRFEVFFEQIGHFDCIRQKRECRHNADEVRFFGRTKNKLHHLKFRVYETICSRSLISRSFDSGSNEACLVRMRDNVLLLHSWDGRPYLFCSRTRLCIALALGC